MNLERITVFTKCKLGCCCIHNQPWAFFGSIIIVVVISGNVLMSHASYPGSFWLSGISNLDGPFGMYFTFGGSFTSLISTTPFCRTASSDAGLSEPPHTAPCPSLDRVWGFAYGPYIMNVSRVLAWIGFPFFFFESGDSGGPYSVLSKILQTLCIIFPLVGHCTSYNLLLLFKEHVQMPIL